MATFILVGYFSILAILCLYGGHRWYLTRLFHKCANEVKLPAEEMTELPEVTVQLPVFNEKFVIERLIDATAAIRYPKDKLHIQVLDDSTDETRQLASARVDYWRERGFRIDYIHRVDRTGFKAGALANGLHFTNADYVAIFDADFIPDPEILHKTIHYFSDPKVGMVQARWDHLNRTRSTLTQVQAILLDAHFVIEHGGRCYSNRYFNFNGTAGVWRKAAIADAGGWQHDTLTEDLDLSYRAQLKGWRFLFIPGITCPAELPESVSAFKSQQHRWAKGSIQVMKKLLPQIWRSDIPLKVKMEATFHLTGNLAYILMVINSIFFVIPSMVVREDLPWWLFMIIDGPLFVMLSLSFIYFYLTSQYAIYQSIKGRKRYIPALMAIGIGLGVNNSRAVFEALMGKESPFVRTPKDGATDTGGKARLGYKLPNSGWGYIEVFLGFLYTCGIIWAVLNGKWVSIPFLVIFQNGFYFMGCMTLAEEMAQSRARAKLAAQKA